MKILLTALFLYGGYCLLLYFAQRQMMYPRYLLDAGSGQPPRGAVSEWVETAFGPVETWFLPPAADAAPAPAMIVAHGNGELIDYLPAEFAPVRAMGIGVLLVEYPGYGRSAGSPSQERIAEVFTRAYDMLAARADTDEDRIVFFGRSLGGGAVCELTRHRSARALILVSTFTSARAFARRYLAPGFLVKDPFDNAAALERYTGPVLVAHGRRDEVVAYRHAEALARVSSGARLMTLECGHNDCPPDPHRFWNEVAAFLKKAGVLNG